MISLYLTTFYLIIHRLCAALSHEIFMQRESQEATAYINFSLAMEMKFIQSIGWSIQLLHPSFEHTSIISYRRLDISKVLISQ